MGLSAMVESFVFSLACHIMDNECLVISRPDVIELNYLVN